MFSRFVSICKITRWENGVRKTLATSSSLNFSVSVVGASGGVGQPLSLLLKLSPYVNDLSLYDIVNCKGVGTDLSHINTKAKVLHYDKPSLLQEALCNKDIIVCTAGKPRDPGMTRADLFKFNANVVVAVAEAMSKAAPEAMLCIVTNPVNSLVPVAAEILCKNGCFDERKLFGITTLDLVRASTFAGELMCYDPTDLVIPVIGGHSGITIVPLFSQSSLPIKLPKDKLKALVERVQNAGTEVVKAKAGKGSATLSTAFAVARFVFSLCRGMKGEKNVIECAYVKSDLTDATYFASPLLLGKNGIKKNLGYGKLSPEECSLLNKAVAEVLKDIEVGMKFVLNEQPPKK